MYRSPFLNFAIVFHLHLGVWYSCYMANGIIKTSTQAKRPRAQLHPSLLRGEERLRYMQKFKGSITPERAKVLLKEMAHARKSWDRVIIRKK